MGRFRILTDLKSLDMPIANLLRKLVAWNPVYAALVTLWEWIPWRRVPITALLALLLVVTWTFGMDDCTRAWCFSETFSFVLSCLSKAYNFALKTLAMVVSTLVYPTIYYPKSTAIIVCIVATAMRYMPLTLADVSPMARNAFARVSPIARAAFARVAAIARNVGDVVSRFCRKAERPAAPSAQQVLSQKHSDMLNKNVQLRKKTAAASPTDSDANGNQVLRPLNILSASAPPTDSVTTDSETPNSEKFSAATGRVQKEYREAELREAAASGDKSTQPPTTASATPSEPRPATRHNKRPRDDTEDTSDDSEDTHSEDACDGNKAKKTKAKKPKAK